MEDSQMFQGEEPREIDLEGTERSVTLEAITLEPEAVVEQGMDFVQAEAIETAFVALVDHSPETTESSGDEGEGRKGSGAFEPSKHYTTVQMEEGDVQKDDDWNESGEGEVQKDNEWNESGEGDAISIDPQPIFQEVLDSPELIDKKGLAQVQGEEISDIPMPLPEPVQESPKSISERDLAQSWGEEVSTLPVPIPEPVQESPEPIRENDLAQDRGEDVLDMPIPLPEPALGLADLIGENGWIGEGNILLAPVDTPTGEQGTPMLIGENGLFPGREETRPTSALDDEPLR
jgi:hypothetical protein